jgi:hypothetical protein
MSLCKATTGVAWGLAGIVITLLSGCGGNSSFGPGANTTSQLRSVNALVCGNYNALNFAQRSATANIATAVVYGQATAYATVPAGNGVNDFAVQNGTVVAQNSYDLQPNGSYSLVATGDCSQSVGSGVGPVLLQFTDNPPTAAQLGSNAGLRLVHASPATAAGYSVIDVYNSGQPLNGLTNITYGGATGYAVVPAAIYNLTLHSHANNNLLILPPATTTALGSLNLAAGHSYTLLVIGTTSNVPNEIFDVKVIQDN